jgi:hypothetical protein
MKIEFKMALIGTITMSFICMAVSYGAMYEVAMMHRIAVAELFPLVVDGTMCLSMFIRVYFSKIGKPTQAPLLIMGFFTLTSIIVNAVAARDALEMYIYSIAPIGVFACTELSAMIIEKQPVVRRKRNATPRRPKQGPLQTNKPEILG